MLSKLFRNNRWCTILVILFSGILFLAGCAPKERDFPTSPTLSELADPSGILVGAAVQPDLIADEPQYVEILAAQFNSITSESHMKWGTTEPQHMTYTWDNADAVAAFAKANNMTIRGHTLVWPNEFQYQNIPDYVKDAPDAGTMQQYIDDHIEAVVSRYADVVDRWDVINEPLKTLGSGVDQNIITATLGEAWMVRAFQQVRSLDPCAKLYLNEALAERPGAKHNGLLALVGRLLDAGAPIDGIGLQGHFLVGTPSVQELTSVMQDWEALGLEVAITEVDIVTWFGNEEAQAVQYRNVMTACLSVAACGEVTLWGFSDKHTWLNSYIGTWTTPLLFDADYLPKPAYAAVSAALAGNE